MIRLASLAHHLVLVTFWAQRSRWATFRVQRARLTVGKGICAAKATRFTSCCWLCLICLDNKSRSSPLVIDATSPCQILDRCQWVLLYPCPRQFTKRNHVYWRQRRHGIQKIQNDDYPWVYPKMRKKEQTNWAWKNGTNDPLCANPIIDNFQMIWKEQFGKCHQKSWSKSTKVSSGSPLFPGFTWSSIHTRYRWMCVSSGAGEVCETKKKNDLFVNRCNEVWTFLRVLWSCGKMH